MQKYTIAGFGDIYVKDGLFDKGIKALKKKVPFWTSEEFAEARMLDAKQKGSWRQSDLCTNGSWTTENYNYDDETRDILIASKDFSTILTRPGKATKTHRNKKEFPISAPTWSVLREHAEKDPEKAIKSGVLLLQRKDYRPKVPFTAFAEYAPTIFHYRTQAKAYGEFLTEALAEKNITSNEHHIANQQNKKFSRALWVRTLYLRSDLSGDNDGLCSNLGRVGGVNRLPAERAAPETPEKPGFSGPRNASISREPAQEAKILLEERIQQALKKGIPFTYEGKIYVPICKDIIEDAE